MYEIFLVFFIVIAFTLITLIILQKGKGPDVGSSFRGESNTLFSSSNSVNFITRITMIFAVLFFIISLVLDNANCNKTNKRIEATKISTPVQSETLQSKCLGKPTDIP